MSFLHLLAVVSTTALSTIWTPAQKEQGYKTCTVVFEEYFPEYEQLSGYCYCFVTSLSLATNYNDFLMNADFWYEIYVANDSESLCVEFAEMYN